MPTFVSGALTSDSDPETVQRCLEDVHVAEKLLDKPTFSDLSRAWQRQKIPES